MGVIKKNNASVKALTTAALVLPGLLPAITHADGDEVDFQYSHYQEGKRDIYGSVYDFNAQSLSKSSKLPNTLNPIEVDSLHGSARVSLTERVKFAFNYLQDTWSGATPIGTAPALINGNRPHYSNPDGTGTVTSASPLARDVSAFFMDKSGNIYAANQYDPITGQPMQGFKDNRLTHVLAAASPETRKQGDFQLSYDWGDTALSAGGGISVENDYESRFGNLGLRLDFNQKRTTLNLGLSYTNSDTHATLDPDGLQFFDTSQYDNLSVVFVTIDPSGNSVYQIVPKDPLVASGEIESAYQFQQGGYFQRTNAVLRGNRQDWVTQLGLTQVLNKNAVMELGMSYTRSTGYLGNPYKLVYAFFASPYSNQDISKPLAYGGNGLLEVRPDERNLFNWHFGYNQYVEPFDAALHFDYNFAHDDWGINAHTFEADWVQPLVSGWTLTPRIRYYSQTAANFYVPFITSVQLIDPLTGQNVDSPINKPLPQFYASDQRLSGFGTLSGGLTLAKQFSKGISLETGFEYYTHQGGLMLGGRGEKDFADFDYWVANASLKLNLDALTKRGGGSPATDHYHQHQHSNNPAGIMFGHTLQKAGDFMVGYRFMRNNQAGNMLLGNHTTASEKIHFNACGTQECAVAPDFMVMNMHMLDLMYAPTDWLTLMLMPQWVDMEMHMNPLFEQNRIGHNHGGAVHSHQTGGIGDTGLYALAKLFENPNHHLVLSLGGTAPTGDYEVTLRKTHINYQAKTFVDYGMQLGSGTWDFKPSLTYSGNEEPFLWGAQATGTLRLQNRNSAGFALGDIFQGSVWGGYQWNDWLTNTVRGIYTWQDRVHGGYLSLKQAYGDDTPYPYSTHTGPFDFPGNYGGRFVDLGLGVNVTIPSGAFVGNTFKFEWLQPVHTEYNGYQLDRDYALNFTWSYGF